MSTGRKRADAIEKILNETKKKEKKQIAYSLYVLYERQCRIRLCPTKLSLFDEVFVLLQSE